MHASIPLHAARAKGAHISYLIVTRVVIVAPPINYRSANLEIQEMQNALEQQIDDDDDAIEDMAPSSKMINLPRI